MTDQQMFTKVARHLIKQGKKSIKDGQCLYRGPEGTSCAIGCLIPDEMYTEEIEGKAVSEHEALELVLASLGITNLNLAMDLQSIHDGYSPDSWKSSLGFLAEKYNLRMPKL